MWRIFICWFAQRRVLTFIRDSRRSLMTMYLLGYVKPFQSFGIRLSPWLVIAHWPGLAWKLTIAKRSFQTLTLYSIALQRFVLMKSSDWPSISTYTEHESYLNCAHTCNTCRYIVDHSSSNNQHNNKINVLAHFSVLNFFFSLEHATNSNLVFILFSHTLSLCICMGSNILQVVMHVSTAYSNCHLRFIEEKFYNYPFHFDDLSRLIDKLDDKALDNITPT